MPKKLAIKNGIVYTCEVCGFGYKHKDTAQKCQDWCSKRSSCNLQITKDAVYFPK